MLHSLLVSILLCHYEVRGCLQEPVADLADVDVEQVISGDTRSILYHHLRASRDLIHSLLARQGLTGNSAIDDTSLGLCLELYAYILITTSSKPQGIGPECTIKYDPFVMSLSKLGAYTTFGTMFGSYSGLFELIPRVTLFAAQRLCEEQIGSSLPSETSCAMYSHLKQDLEQWRLRNPHSDDAFLDDQASAAAEALRSALRIYLATAFAGSLVSEPKILIMVQSQIDAILSTTRVAAHSRFATVLLWPLLVAGSCMTYSDQRTQLISRLRANRFRMQHVYAVCEVLEKLWATDSSYAYGPYGLFLMEQKGFSFPML